jgi:acetyltransferase-like isoleucine patch superfamily enzyme
MLPLSIRILYTNFLVRRKYDVVFEKGATGGKSTFFEGKNLLKKKAQVHNSHIGLGTYVSGNAKLNKAKIGRFCSIGQNVSNAFGIHPTDWVSTHPCFYSLQKQAGFTFVKNQLFEEHKFIDENNKYHIQIGNDVWIGNDVKIMDGVLIGDGAIIGTGAVVTKDVEPYSIVGGIPARLIRYRFTKEMIAILLEIKWWERDKHWLEKNAHFFVSGKISISDLKHLKDIS